MRWRQAPGSKTKPHVDCACIRPARRPDVGSQGERLAADYLVSQLKRIGARPLPGAADFRLPFDFTAGTKDGGGQLTLSCVERETQPGTISRCGGTLGGGYRHALVLRRWRGLRSRGIRGLRHRRSRFSGLRVRQLRRPGRKGQGRRGPSIFPGGRRRQDQGYSRALFGLALQGHGGAAAGREGHARRRRSTLAECRSS